MEHCNSSGFESRRNKLIFNTSQSFPNEVSQNNNKYFTTLEEVKAEWSRSTELLNEALASVTEEHLSADCPFKSPIGDNTNDGTFAFLVQHESYDIGQMAFLKKYYTKEAMKY